ncbi:hypothetical protein EYC80_006917 [Monilinia laxa]|uniref:Uncharacterized protein n=1 Tax=Monilinia laxa TaxID=61186 RepID=A0A5N6JZJ5_MONLA|nr:hypothetical protein EYC80_006917 [Monilinia laxa]
MFSTQNLNLFATTHPHRHTKQHFLFVNNFYLITKLRTHVGVVNLQLSSEITVVLNIIRQKSPDTLTVFSQSQQEQSDSPHMNNNSNLSIYIQLITFRKGSAEEFVIDVPEDCQVETTRCLCKRLNYRFRYSYDTRKAIITRNSSFHSLKFLDLNDFETDTQVSFYDEYINTRDADMDAEISSYQESATIQPEIPGDFVPPGQNVGFADELFAEGSLNLDTATFDDPINDFQSEQNGGDILPDWIELVNIVDQHHNLDTEMLDVDTCQLKGSNFGNVLESCENAQLETNPPASIETHNLMTDIPSWRDLSIGPVLVLDTPTPQPLSRVDSFQSMPSEDSQSQEIDIVVKPTLTRSEVSVSNTPSSYQEGVFSSTPGLSSVPTNYGSSPRRMGPLESVTRAKANAVKAIGACWRCKFLRKPCDAQIFCSRCMGKHSGPWHSIGCKRGDIKKRMLPISLCPRKTIGSLHSSAISDMSGPWIHADDCHLKVYEQREKDLLPGIINAPGLTKVDKFLRNVETGKLFLIGLQPAQLPLMGRLKKISPAVLRPLNDCILTILWGLLECESSQKAILPWMSLHNGTLGDFIILLNSAAVYQASVGSNQLIAYSLMCLRTCIEALHVNDLKGLEDSHEACEASICKVDCTQNVELQLEQYLDELSRVIFLKENMRSRIWWLSVFYSLCIQSVIRQALILLSPNDQEELRSTQYLQIAVRLFTVSSGTYDPLIRDWSSESTSSNLEDGPSVEDYHDAQLAVKQPDWRLWDIKNSATYLKKVFEDSGGILAEPTQ